MNTHNQQAPSAGGFSLSPSDIYFILFRHKKKIAFFFLLGVAAAVAIFMRWPMVFQSDARLLIRWVSSDRGALDDPREVAPGGRGSEHVIGTEIAILRSLDLAQEVARLVKDEVAVFQAEDPELPGLGPNGIMSGLLIDSPRGSNLINLTFAHEHPEIARIALQRIIGAYLDRHVAVHSASVAYEDHLTQSRDRLRERLNQTEQELLREKQRLGVSSVPEAKSTLNNEVNRIRSAIFAAQADIAEQAVVLEQLHGVAPAQPAREEQLSPEVPVIDEATEVGLATAMIEYNRHANNLQVLRAREQELSLRFTPESRLLQNTRTQIANTERELAAIRDAYPAIVATETAQALEQAVPQFRGQNLAAQEIRLKSLQARVNQLRSQQEEVRDELARLDAAEIHINDLERRRTLEDGQYQNLLATIERKRLDAMLDAGEMNNMRIIQTPSPGYSATTEKMKFSAMALGAGLFIGLAWAFLVELVLDRSIKRPIEVQRDLGLPLFLTLPDTNARAFKKLRAGTSAEQKRIMGKQKSLDSRKTAYLPESTTLKAAALSKPELYGSSGNSNDNGEIVPWDNQHALHNYFEALRDRVIGYFESRNLVHKPKLIALTGVGDAPGVSTIAAGLAGSLSKTEGGNVLLVDMTMGRESAQQFYKGREIGDLNDALEHPDRARLGDNLYVVAEGTNGYKLPNILPSRFNSIVPKLKASDFDYIIFDMPAVSPISSTPRLASFMDVVLMVVESETTDKSVVQQATALLSDSKAHLGVVLNKTKTYVPKQLEQDFLGLS